jgi:hypothetical protein
MTFFFFDAGLLPIFCKSIVPAVVEVNAFNQIDAGHTVAAVKPESSRHCVRIQSDL